MLFCRGGMREYWRYADLYHGVGWRGARFLFRPLRRIEGLLSNAQRPRHIKRPGR